MVSVHIKSTEYLAGYTIVVRDSRQSFFVKDYMLRLASPQRAYNEKNTLGVRKEKREYRVG